MFPITTTRNFANQESTMKKLTALLAGAALMLMATSAMAIPITGSIDFTGAEILTPLSTSLVNATGLKFLSGEVHGVHTGTFAPIAIDTAVTFNNLIFKPAPTLVNPFWTLTFLGTTYSFDLQTIAVDLQSATHLDLSGTGILHATGYDDTPGVWFYSTQGNGSTFSAQNTAAPVPEPATLLLLGAGFFGLAIFSKRSKNQNPTCAA
jgi:hypothetical protein